MVNSGPGSR
jgi:hypothetical protein